MGEPITKEILSKYKGWRLRVKQDKERIAEAENAAQIPSKRDSDGSQHQSRVSGGMPAADRLIDLKDMLQPTIDENLKKMKQIERAINNMPDPMEQSVLIARYIAGDGIELNKWADVARMVYGKDDENAIRAATRLHGRALLSIAKEEF